MFYLLRRMIERGTLRLTMASGRTYVFGAGAPEVALRLHRRKPLWLLSLRPDLKIAQAYEDGSLTIEQGNLRDFRYILFINYRAARQKPLFRLLDYLSGGARAKIGGFTDKAAELYGFAAAADCHLSNQPFPSHGHGPQAHLPPLRAETGKLRPVKSRSWRRLFSMQMGWFSFAKNKIRPAGVTLSLGQYAKRLSAAADKPGRATRFCLAAIATLRQQYSEALKSLAAHLQPRQMGTLYDQSFFGERNFFLMGKGDGSFHRFTPPTIACIRLGKRTETAPWTRNYIFRFEGATRSAADDFVRQETT